MTAEKKFKTFADLRLIPRPDVVPADLQNIATSIDRKTEAPATSTSIARTTSDTSTASSPSIPISTRIPSTSSRTIRSKTTSVENDKPSISPVRDFQKVPNSVTREIMPSGLFKGKSKQVYDYLYSVTRGSINPNRTTRKSRKEIQRGSGIGSMVTVDAALMHLESIGLIRIRSAVGSLSGNEYEILTPEETAFENDTTSTSISSTPPSTPNITSSTSPIQILDDLDIPENGTSRRTETVDNKTAYAPSKTSLKTNIKNDDEKAAAHPVFSLMIEKLETATKKITGRNTSKYEAEKWGNLAELLVLQLEIAATRTGEISSVPAFLTEVLRRKILKPTPQPSAKQSNLKKDVVGKPDDTFETDAEDRQIIKPLDEKGREEALTMISEFAERDEILADFKRWFVEEDWTWLMEKLKK
jgi:hypothetical protein